MIRILAALLLAGASINAQTYTSGDWQYTVSSGEATITGYTGGGGAVTIPSEVNGIPVRNIGSGSEGSGGPPIFEADSDYGNSSVTSVVIPSGVVTISPYAFFGCSGLTSVTLPAGLSSIGSNAFEFCRNLTSISIPSSVSNIGNDAFGSCYRLYYVFIPDSVISVFTNFNETVHVFPPHTTIVTSGLINALANDDGFVTAVANKILAASNNYGLATKTEVGGAVTMGVQQVLSSPSDYNLFTTQQVQNERTAGQNDVLNTPNSFSLYTTNQIHNLGFGGIVLNRNTNNQLVLNYQVLQSADLQNWSPYQQTELVISNAPSDKMFLRVQAVGQ